MQPAWPRSQFVDVGGSPAGDGSGAWRGRWSWTCWKITEVRKPAISRRLLSRSSRKACRWSRSWTATWRRKSSPPASTKTLSTSGQGARGVLEGVDDGAAERPYLHRDQGLDAAVEGGGIDVGVVAADDAPAGERPDPFQAGGGRDAEPAGQLAVGLPRICLEKPDDLRIKFVHVREFASDSDHSFGQTTVHDGRCAILEPSDTAQMKGIEACSCLTTNRS